jgi:TonB family protein
MSNRSDKTWTLALCLSLLIHGGFVLLLIHGYIVDMRHALFLPALEREPADKDDSIYVESEQDRIRRQLVLGDSAGTGTAANASEGDEPMQAPESPEEQAWLSRDPEGFGESNGIPSESTLPQGEGGGGGIAVPVLPQVTENVSPFGIQASADAFTPPAPRIKPALPPEIAIAVGTQETELPTEEPTEEEPTETPAEEPQEGKETEVPEQPRPVAEAETPPDESTPAAAAVASSVPPGTPGSAAESADPAPMSESDSDPFARIGSAEFRPGRVDVKLGRKHKITRPRLLLGGRDALMALGSPSVVLKLKIDETGNVKGVEIVRGSGSNEIDQPCQLAAYNWWFEPALNAAGQPVPDVILFTVQWR